MPDEPKPWHRAASGLQCICTTNCSHSKGLFPKHICTAYAIPGCIASVNLLHILGAAMVSVLHRPGARRLQRILVWHRLSSMWWTAATRSASAPRGMSSMPFLKRTSSKTRSSLCTQISRSAHIPCMPVAVPVQWAMNDCVQPSCTYAGVEGQGCGATLCDLGVLPKVLAECMLKYYIIPECASHVVKVNNVA